MRNFFPLIVGVAGIVIISTSCKKDQDVILNGKWSFVRKVQKAYKQDGSLIYENSIGGNSGDYYDFGGQSSNGITISTGPLITVVNGVKDTAFYSQISLDSVGILPSSGIQELYSIPTKLQSVITLFKKIPLPLLGAGVYEETYINLRK